MMHKKKITVLLLPGLLLFSFMHFSRTENKEFIGISGLTWSSAHNYLYITQYEGKRIDASNLNNNHISGSIKLICIYLLKHVIFQKERKLNIAP